MISVNKSARQFLECVPKENWIGYLKKIGLSTSCIAIEVTEALLLDDRPSVLLALSKFRDAGIQVAIDNYGIGYSAMADLKKFQVNCLKIDCSFIRDMASDANDLAIVEAIIAMAHKLGIQVIAEGVETAWQRDQLIAAGCDYAQGYFFAHPMPPKEMNRLLQQQSL